MNKIFLALALLLVIGFSVAYWKMGGLKAPTITQETTETPYFLAGRYYEGPANDEAFGDLTREAYQLRKDGKIRGDFGNIFYNSPESSRDAAKVFVGIVVADTVSQQLPANYRYRAFAAGQKVVHARIDASYLLAPDKLYTGIKEYAAANKLTLQNVYLERFPDKGEPEVLAVVK
ncbi:hypothetical protein HNQ93_002917 [Hymenobacter luteus]|uniref:AraC family transcriptional regulator n=2 Tax=Hymenobacter TaxID=89966 RepID=A0A7W9WD61_9BACT|nr:MULTISPECIES: hypothetical protein [Hymenobacter]MBB4603153.1 hypothetical protein [Hymenobacter latericoloratus]MBB6060051.1 hypothetical protein [Hymenobacter luteus]